MSNLYTLLEKCSWLDVKHSYFVYTDCMKEANRYTPLFLRIILAGTLIGSAYSFDEDPSEIDGDLKQVVHTPEEFVKEDSLYYLDFSARSTTRFRAENFNDAKDRERLQQRVTLQLQATIKGGWKIIGIAQSGPAFRSGYDTVYDSRERDNRFTSDNFTDNYSVRRLYIEGDLSDDVSIQLGAIPVERGLNSDIVSLSTNGWINGGRLKMETEKLGKVTIVAGTLGETNEVNAFKRDTRFDYIEVNIQQEVYEKLLAEVGYEKHQDDEFFKFATNYELETASQKAVKFLAEGLIDINSGKTKASISARADLGNLFNGQDSGITFEIRQAYLSEGFASRGVDYTSGFNNANNDERGAYGIYILRSSFDSDYNNSFLNWLTEDSSWYTRMRHEYVTGEFTYEAGFQKKF